MSLDILISQQYAQTTMGWAGSPSGRNVGLTQPSNPAESGLLLTRKMLDQHH